MEEVFTAIEKIAIAIDQAIKNPDLGHADSENASGEEQLKLDVQCDLLIESTFAKVDSISTVISEEKEEPLKLHPHGEYTVCYDPLDGSSLVDVNLSVGSIFGIYQDAVDGKGISAACYVVYGPRVELVRALRGSPPMLYRLVEGKFVFISTLSLEKKGKIIAPGGTQKEWLPHHKQGIESFFSQGYRLRYSGGMVPDLHQVLLKKGGLFSYPGTFDKPKGKLRLLFEVLPFALIYESAGGYALNDKGERLLDAIPAHIHDTTPCFFGSEYEIKSLLRYYSTKHEHE